MKRRAPARRDRLRRAGRFYALRLHEAGMIGAAPQKIIAQGSDWRFIAEWKKDLRG